MTPVPRSSPSLRGISRSISAMACWSTLVPLAHEDARLEPCGHGLGIVRECGRDADLASPKSTGYSWPSRLGMYRVGRGG